MPTCRAVYGARMVFSFSVDAGETWQMIRNYGIADFIKQDFVHVSEVVPRRAETMQTRFRWEEINFKDAEEYMALDNVTLTARSLPRGWDDGDQVKVIAQATSAHGGIQKGQQLTDWPVAKRATIAAIDSAQCCFGSAKCHVPGFFRATRSSFFSSAAQTATPSEAGHANTSTSDAATTITAKGTPASPLLYSRQSTAADIAAAAAAAAVAAAAAAKAQAKTPSALTSVRSGITGQASGNGGGGTGEGGRMKLAGLTMNPDICRLWHPEFTKQPYSTHTSVVVGTLESMGVYVVGSTSAAAKPTPTTTDAAPPPTSTTTTTAAPSSTGSTDGEATAPPPANSTSTVNNGGANGSARGGVNGSSANGTADGSVSLTNASRACDVCYPDSACGVKPTKTTTAAPKSDPCSDKLRHACTPAAVCFASPGGCSAGGEREWTGDYAGCVSGKADDCGICYPDSDCGVKATKATTTAPTLDLCSDKLRNDCTPNAVCYASPGGCSASGKKEWSGAYAGCVAGQNSSTIGITSTQRANATTARGEKSQTVREEPNQTVSNNSASNDANSTATNKSAAHVNANASKEHILVPQQNTSNSSSNNNGNKSVKSVDTAVGSSLPSTLANGVPAIAPLTAGQQVQL